MNFKIALFALGFIFGVLALILDAQSGRLAGAGVACVAAGCLL